MIHRFVHLGDLHLAPGPRNDDRRRAFVQAVDESLALEGLAAWLGPGDLNHGRMSIDDRNFLAAQFQRMAAVAPVVITPGNHDLPGDLDVFARLKAAWPIHVIATPQVLSLPLPTGGTAAVFVLPYPTRAGLVAAGAASLDVAQEARTALDAIFMVAAEQLAAATASGAIPLMIGHINVGGAVTSVGQPNIGQEIELDGALLDRLGPIYKGLNHIHKAQTIHGAHYAGSMCRLDWGEIEAKQYILVEVARVFVDAPFVYSIHQRPLDVAPAYHVEVRFDGSHEHIGDTVEVATVRLAYTLRVTRGPEGEALEPPASWAGCDVRVRYTFPASLRSVIDPEPLKALFAGARLIQLEPVAVPDRAVRAPEVAAAVSLADKVRAYAKVNGLQVPDGAIGKLSELERREATAVLTDVANACARLEREDAPVNRPVAEVV